MSDLTIEQMLDAVAAMQISCPVCGMTGHIDYVEATWLCWNARANLNGSVSYGGDSEYCDPPAHLTTEIPAFLCCGDTKGHPDGRAHWFVIDRKIATYDDAFDPHQGV